MAESHPRTGDVVISAVRMEPHEVTSVRGDWVHATSMVGGPRTKRFRIRDLEEVDQGLYQEMTRG